MKPQVELDEQPTMTHVHADIPGHTALETAIANLARMTSVELYYEKIRKISDAEHG